MKNYPDPFWKNDSLDSPSEIQNWNENDDDEKIKGEEHEEFE